MKKDLILKVEELTKSYGSKMAVDRVSFYVEPGKIIGLLGPNGAGKTTTINMILGILQQTDGKIEIFGKNAEMYRSQINSKLNFAAVYAHVPQNMTVWQNLYVFALIYDVPKPKEKVNLLIKQFDLEKFSNKKAGLLSSGELSRLNIAKAILNDPCLLLLDEPTASLDPHIANTIRNYILDYVKRTNAAVLWTSHNMNEITTVCDEVYFLSHGKILLQGDPKKLPAMYGKNDLEELFITVAKEPLSLTNDENV